MEGSKIPLKPSLFNYPFWIVVQTVLFIVNIYFCGMFFAPDQLYFWLALASVSGQVFFFGSAMIFVWQLYTSRFIHSPRMETAFYAAVGFLAALYVSNFIYFRITGVGLALFFDYLKRLPWADIRDLFIAAEITRSNLFLIFAVLAGLPPVLWFLSLSSVKLARLRPLRIPSAVILIFVILCLSLTAACQGVVRFRGDFYRWNLFTDSLPVHMNIFGIGEKPITLKARVRSYERLDRKAENLKLSADHLPEDLNVFIIIAETIRQDYITKEIAPNIYEFQQNNISFRHSFCSGNSTHYSWFSILFGAHPIYWNTQRREKDQLGSPALQILKKAGFKIHLYSKPHHLRYLNFGSLCFGEGKRLVDRSVITPSLETCEADQYSIDALGEFIRKGLPGGRNLYLLFLDSTHHNYSFPETFEKKFRPCIDDFSYLKLDYSSEDVEKIKNRYKNALYYMDSLFGQLMGELKKTKSYRKSVIGFIADHGEEFMEYGALIHGSNLFDPQTRVPILFKNIEGTKQRIDQTISGIDFFPTLLDILGLLDQSESVLQGTSALDTGRQDCAIIANNHGAQDPYDFTLFNGNLKLRFLLDRREPLASRQIMIRTMYDHKDRPLFIDRGDRERLSTFIHMRFSAVLQGVSFLEFEAL